MTDKPTQIPVARPFVALQLAEQNQNADGTVWLHLFDTGTFLKDTFREFALTTHDFDTMIQLNKKKRRRKNKARVMLDYNHGSAIGLSPAAGIAAGWLADDNKALQKRNNGRELWGRFELTDRAREQIKANEWKYISPDFIPKKDPFTGESREPELLAAALTNRPATDLAPIDSTQLNIIGASTPNKEADMTREEIQAIVQEAMQANQQQTLLSQQAQPPTPAITATDIATAVAEAMKPVSTKLSEFVDGQDQATKERQITLTLGKHIERGAVAAKEVERVRPLLLSAKDFDAALKGQDEFYAALPDGDSKADKDNTAKGEDNSADSTLLSNIDQFIEKQVAEGKVEHEAIMLAQGKFGQAAFDKWNNKVVAVGDTFYHDHVDEEAA